MQNAEAGVSVAADSDQTSAWEQPDRLPGMLQWNPDPMVHLYWCRVRHGEFETPGRSTEGLPTDGSPAQLDFKGRTADSLRFEVSGGLTPPGYGTLPPAPPPPPAPGFRYDLADDRAVPLPEVVTAPAPTTAGFSGGLTAYPFFAFVAPGAPVEPPSLTSVALAVEGALRTHCQFEAALKWYELAYAPLARDDTWAACEAADLATAEGSNPDVPCCPAAPVPPPQARDRAVLLAYLETLLQWGESYLCQGSPESVQRAGVILETLARILGARPRTVLAGGTQPSAGDPASVAGFEPRPAPLNPRLISLYDRTADRLALVHRGADGHRLRNRTPRRDAAFWNEDPSRDGWREPGETCRVEGLCDAADCRCCRSPYRFASLIQKALDLANDTHALGAALLSAYEKGDAEALAALRATHERQLTELTLAVRQYAWREADWQVQALSLAKQGAEARLRYYRTLLDGGLNSGETAYTVLTGLAMLSHTSPRPTAARRSGR